MAEQYLNRLKFEIGGSSFNLELKAPTIAIVGNSGIGKTLFCNSLAAYRALNALGVDVAILDFKATENSLQDLLRSKGERLLVIDNANRLITRKETVKLLDSTSSQLIIIGRNTDFFEIPDFYVAYMEEDEEGVLVLRYLED